MCVELVGLTKLPRVGTVQAWGSMPSLLDLVMFRRKQSSARAAGFMYACMYQISTYMYVTVCMYVCKYVCKYV